MRGKNSGVYQVTVEGSFTVPLLGKRKTTVLVNPSANLEEGDFGMVILKSGKRFLGQIFFKEKKLVQIQLADGDEKTIQRDKILNIHPVIWLKEEVQDSQ